MRSYKGVISLFIWVISIGTLLITLLITTHEPPSKPAKLRSFFFSTGFSLRKVCRETREGCRDAAMEEP